MAWKKNTKQYENPAAMSGIFRTKNPKLMSGSFKGEQFDTLCEILQDADRDVGVVVFLAKDKGNDPSRPYYISITKAKPKEGGSKSGWKGKSTRKAPRKEAKYEEEEGEESEGDESFDWE